MTDIMINGSTLANDLKLPPQAKHVLRYLEKGKTLTNLEALMLFGFTGSSLAGAIKDLRDAGHDVFKTMLKDLNGRKYAEYQLNSRLRLV